MSEEPKTVNLKFQQVFISSKGKGKTDICFLNQKLLCLTKGNVK